MSDETCSSPTSSRVGSLQLAPDEVHCWCADLDVSPETLARLDATLTPDEHTRSARLRFSRDRRHFVVAHGVLRDLLARCLEIQPDRIRYAYNRFGKPELGPEFGGRLKFNLSHSAGLALIAIAAESNIGVDLEHIREQPDYVEIARRFFSAGEVAQLSALSSHRYAEAFLGCWTKHEACLKAFGGGLAMPLNGPAVPMTTDPARAPADLQATSSDIVRAARWSVYTLRPAPGYIGALVIEGNGWRLAQRQWDTSMLRA